MIWRFVAVGSTRYMTGTSGIGCLTVFIWRCMVIPQPRRSFTRKTLEMTSLPISSNTKTFHIGSPFSLRMGEFCGRRPLALGSWWSSADCGADWFRFRIFSIEAIYCLPGQQEIQHDACVRRSLRTYRPDDLAVSGGGKPWSKFQASARQIHGHLMRRRRRLQSSKRESGGGYYEGCRIQSARKVELFCGHSAHS